MSEILKPAGRESIEACRRITMSGDPDIIQGKLVTVEQARAIIQVWDSLIPENRSAWEKQPLPFMILQSRVIIRRATVRAAARRVVAKRGAYGSR